MELSFCVATAVVVGFVVAVVVAPDDVVVFVQRVCADDECQSFYPNFGSFFEYGPHQASLWLVFGL